MTHLLEYGHRSSIRRQQGSQRNMLDLMQSRDELYTHLNYLETERKLDQKEADDEREA